MAEVEISYKGSTIASMDASGTKTLLTSGKYCEDDIEVAYNSSHSENIKSVYSLRESKKDAQICVIDKLIGGTVVWNQLVQTNSASVTVPNAHKYLSRINGTNTIAISNGSAISINDGTKDNVFDLTQMFGSTIADYAYSLESNTAGSGVAWLESYGFFTKDYYAYDAGTLMHVNTSAHKIVGANQMKPSNYIVGSASNYAKNAGTTLSSGGSAASASGENPITVTSTTNWRGVTFISNRLIKGKQYKLSLTSTSSSEANKRASLYAIDGDLKILSRVYNYNGTPFNTVSTTYTPNEDNVFLALSVESTSHADIVINDMMLQIGSAEYSQYKEFVYALDSDLVLRGIPKLDANNKLYYDGDEYVSDGTVTRGYNTITLDGVTSGRKFTGVYGSTSNGYAAYWSGVLNKRTKVLCDKFVYSDLGYARMPLYSFIGSSGATTTWTFILPSTVTTLAEANQWLVSNNVHIVYNLLTPTTETADAYQNPIIVDNGFEEFIDGRDIPIPVCSETEYLTTLYGNNKLKTDIILQSKTATLTESTQNIVADPGYDGLSSVVVEGGYSASLIKECIQRDASFTDMTFPSGITKIGAYAFAGCEYFNPSSLPSSITSIGAYAFYDSKLSSLTSLPSGVTSIGQYAFHSTSIALTSFPSSLTTIGQSAFKDCTRLVGSFTMPSSVTTVGDYAFSSCGYITSMDLSGCTNLTKIQSSVFESCARMSSVILPSSVTAIRTAAFRYCISLGSFSCNNTITELGSYVFNGGGSYVMTLRTVSLPNLSASGLSNVFGGSDAAKACKQLEFVDLGSAQSLSSYCFANCYALTTLVLRRTDAICSLGSSNAFTNTPMSGYNGLTGTVYVPSALISTYQTATNWSTLYNAGNVTFVAIEGSNYEL